MFSTNFQLPLALAVDVIFPAFRALAQIRNHESNAQNELKMYLHHNDSSKCIVKDELLCKERIKILELVMMIKYALLISSFFFATINSFGQKRQSDNYIILTVEDSYSNGFEGIKKYYWIIEVDSIKNSDNKFYPLLFEWLFK